MKKFFLSGVADSERVCTKNGSFLMHSPEITKDIVQWNKFPILRTEAEGTFCANVTIAHKKRNFKLREMCAEREAA